MPSVERSRRDPPSREELERLLDRWLSVPAPPSWSPLPSRRMARRKAHETAVAERDAAGRELRSLWWSREVVARVCSVGVHVAEELWRGELGEGLQQSWWRTACNSCGRLLRPVEHLWDESVLEDRPVTFRHFACPSCGRWEEARTFPKRLEWIGDPDDGWEIAEGEGALVVNCHRGVPGGPQPTWCLAPTGDDRAVNTLLEALARPDCELPAPGRCLVLAGTGTNARRLLQHTGFVLEDTEHLPDLTPRDPLPDRPRRAVIITTVVGTGEEGSSGDGGPATAAQLRSPRALAIAPDGSLYLADVFNYRVRRVDPSGIITTVVGTGEEGSSGDGGPATAAQLYYPSALALAPDGSLYIADTSHHRVRRVDPNGIITTVAGTGEKGFSGDGGPATAAELRDPSALALAPDGSFYLADTYNHRVRRVDPNGIISTVAGTGEWGFSGDGGPATAAQLRSPRALALAPDGSLYLADTYNYRVRRVDPSGIISTVAGTGEWGFSGDGGPATAAQLDHPSALALAPDGSLYLANTYNHRVRRVDPSGIITTVAGTGEWGFSGDGGPPTAAELRDPSALALAPDGSLYIADAGNNRVRRVAWADRFQAGISEGPAPASKSAVLLSRARMGNARAPIPLLTREINLAVMWIFITCITVGMGIYADQFFFNTSGSGLPFIVLLGFFICGGVGPIISVPAFLIYVGKILRELDHRRGRQ